MGRARGERGRQAGRQAGRQGGRGGRSAPEASLAPGPPGEHARRARRAARQQFGQCVALPLWRCGVPSGRHPGTARRTRRGGRCGSCASQCCARLARHARSGPGGSAAAAAVCLTQPQLAADRPQRTRAAMVRGEFSQVLWRWKGLLAAFMYGAWRDAGELQDEALAAAAPGAQPALLRSGVLRKTRARAPADAASSCRHDVNQLRVSQQGALPPVAL